MSGTEPARGPSERFAVLYRTNFQAIYAYVLRRVHPDEAPDVLQEVFAAAWRSLEGVPEAPEDRLWLYVVARRVIGRSERRRRRQRSLEARFPERGSLGGDAALPPSLRAELQVAIDALSEADRELLALLMWEDLSHRDAAMVLGCSPGALDVRLHRIKARLRASLAPTPGAEHQGLAMARAEGVPCPISMS
ncbi:MAG: sigma-70 family RNA polymerase sigma factor [Actinomycetota bacterium]|nr:sigma-70 family RNA polymerase sigma factor [Actinomycetota bacterium]